MSTEEKIKQGLISKFSFLEGKIQIPRPRRISLEVALEDFARVFEYTIHEEKFVHLCTITGLDESTRLAFIYHLADDTGKVMNIKTSVPRENPVLKSIIPYFINAEIYERELADLFGAKIEGLPPGNRYPLTDDWPVDQFPLRKDWKPAAEEKKEVDDYA